MEMGVKAGGQAVTVEQTKPRTDRRNSSELDLWLEKAEAMGELKRITAEVSCDLEAAHITYLDRKSTRLNSSHSQQSRMPSSA